MYKMPEIPKDWTASQYEWVQSVADTTAKSIGIKDRAHFRRWTQRQGKASYWQNSFTLPIWIKDEPVEYIVAYIVHEVVHLHPKMHGEGHSAAFIGMENAALLEWGLAPAARRKRGNRYISGLNGPSGFIPASGLPGSPYLTMEKYAEAVRLNTHAPCQCGCGGTPKGKRSRFLPGHDARMHE